MLAIYISLATCLSLRASWYKIARRTFSYSKTQAWTSNIISPNSSINMPSTVPPMSASPSSDAVEVDQLADLLASTNLNRTPNSQWVYYPPGTSLDEQLLILAWR